MADSEDLRLKVDHFLRLALDEADPETRTRLIAKATYWDQQARRRAGDWSPRRANPWETGRGRAM